MIAPDIEIDEIDPDHWRHWWEILWPPALSHDRGWAVALLDDTGAIYKVVGHAGATSDGSSLGWTGMTRAELERLRRALDVEIFIALDDDVPAEVIAEAEAEPGTDGDLGRLALAYWRALKRRADAGRVGMAPPLLDALPAIDPDAVQRTFDALVDAPSALVAYVFADDGSGIESSIIVSKDGGDFVFVSTNQIIDDAIAPAAMARRWRHDHRRVTRVVSERIDPVSIGVFASRGAVERILTGPADQLARELAQKNVIVDPAPAWLKVLLGGAAMAGVASRGARALSGLMPKAARKLAGGVAESARTTLRESSLSPWALLGFDPIDLWLQVRGWFYPARR